MNVTKKIEVRVNGPVQSGKSAVLQTVKDALEADGIGVIYAERAQRHNPPHAIEVAEHWERPDADRTVVVLVEQVD